jgi:hypothetical protein
MQPVVDSDFELPISPFQSGILPTVRAVGLAPDARPIHRKGSPATTRGVGGTRTAYESVQHATEIASMQKKHARAAGFTEPTPPDSLVDGALNTATGVVRERTFEFPVSRLEVAG